MDASRRDRLNQLGSELASILEDASTRAALLPRIGDVRCPAAIDDLREAIAREQALLAAMQALAAPEPDQS